MEMVPGDLAARVATMLTIPTVGIGAGSGCDAQLLVWQDMTGLRTTRPPRFVKRYADLHTALTRGRPRTSPADVAAGTFPGPEHTF
jgi:3-methyl-2-oxobutanoate hydroxymethyltransferase